MRCAIGLFILTGGLVAGRARACQLGRDGHEASRAAMPTGKQLRSEALVLVIILMIAVLVPVVRGHEPARDSEILTLAVGWVLVRLSVLGARVVGRRRDSRVWRPGEL